MDEAGGAAKRRLRRPGPVLLVAGAAVVLVAGVAVLVSRSNDGGERGPEGRTETGAGSEGGVPDDVLSGPGTELRGGITVAPGSSLIGPDISSPTLVLVEGDPATVWTAYVEQAAEQFPDEGIDPSQLPGCGHEPDLDDPVCELQADVVEGEPARRRVLRLSMRSVPGDVTGSYVLGISETSYTDPDLVEDRWEGGGDPSPGGGLPEPRPARPRPAVGEPLAPMTTAYDDDNERYVLLEDSELVVQYGVGSITGGFDVLLRTSPGSDVQAVARAYAEQAVQFEGEPVPSPTVREHGEVTVTRYNPPGGAGGYSGTVTAIDQPGDDDYIRYSLVND